MTEEQVKEERSSVNYKLHDIVAGEIDMDAQLRSYQRNQEIAIEDTDPMSPNTTTVVQSRSADLSKINI